MQEGKVNYFIGNDPKKWRTNIPTYSSVRYKEIYKGIDIKFYGNNRQIEYDIIVKPGGDPNNVKLAYEGIEGIKVTENGDLQIVLKEGSIIQKKPVIYQEINGEKIAVDGRFKIQTPSTLAGEGRCLPSNVSIGGEGKDVIARSAGDEAIPSVEISSPSTRNDTTTDSRQFSYTFEVASYSKSHDLIIDPVIVWSTYLGGNGSDVGGGIAVDGSGNVYVTGSAYSVNFPIASAMQETNKGYYDVFVAKIDASGSRLIYSTYFGGDGWDTAADIAIDAYGNAYIIGRTDSTDFSLVSPIDSICERCSERGQYYSYFGPNFTNIFVTKINAKGNAIVYSTYLGGSGHDAGSAIAVDVNGNAYITGTTFGDFPLVSPIDTYGGWYTAFAAKIDASGTSLVYSTYLNRYGGAVGTGIAVDAYGNAYIVGGGNIGDCCHSSVFVTKMNAEGSAVIYYKVLGGSDYDVGTDIAVDTAGNAYITGYSTCSWCDYPLHGDFPLVFPIDTTAGSTSFWDRYEAFVSKIDASGNLVYSTYLGGSGGDVANGIAVDSSGNMYVTGWTTSYDFPIVSPIQATNAGAADAFITKIDASGSSIVYSTYIGGENYDVGGKIAVDTSGNAYMIGYTLSPDFPTVSPIQATKVADNVYDAFVVKIGEPTIVDYINQTATDINNATFIGSGKQQNALLDKINIAVSALNANPPDTELAILVLNDFYNILCNMKKQGKIDANTYNMLYNDYVSILKSLGQTPKSGCK